MHTSPLLRRRWHVLAGATLAAAALAGVAPASQARPVMVEAALYAPIAPPPPPVEVVPMRPYARAVWVPGHWVWKRGAYVWQRGHYARPHRDMRWEPAQWRPRGGGWVYVPGHWVR